MTWRSRLVVALRRAPWLIPLGLGVVAFFVVTGGRILAPRNIAWLARGDEATYFLGWHFFRNSPWSFPLGLSPRYGAELSSAIAFVDNVPLFEFPCKLARSLLPPVWQYFGLWTLCCFVLQAWFGWLLSGLVARAPLERACGAALFLFAPPFLWRLWGHVQMEGQWLILAALYLTLSRRELGSGWAWPVLALCASLVHSYITVMVVGLWLCDWIRRVVLEKRRSVRELSQILSVPLLCLLSFWQSGLFVGTALRGSGFGYYRMNALSLIDPSGWSYLLPDIAEGQGDYEGFAYLGLGVLALALLALPALKTAARVVWKKRQYWPLLALCLGLTLVALSNEVGFGSHTFEIPLSNAWLDRANTLRGSGRMFWPVFYLLVWLIFRAICRRYSARVAAVALATAALLQAADTSAGWRPIRKELMVAGPTWQSPLKSPFWHDVPASYDVIRLVPPRNLSPDFAVFAYFAAMNGMSTDAVYFARIDRKKLGRARAEASRAVNVGKYPERTLFVIEDPRAERPARRSLHADRDWLGRVDGFLVLAPGWKCRPACMVAGSTAPECSATCAEH